MKLTGNDWLHIEREASKRSLSHFVKLGWKNLEPAEKYLHNWHMDAMGEHLQAATAGQITRLLINVPPGTSKSSVVSVFWPAWMWGPAGKPQFRFIGAAHEKTLATRDSRRTRLLVESKWYQDRWPTEITSDQNEKTFFENTKRGFRQASAVASMTGKRGHVVVWDDPINPLQAGSPVARAKAIEVFTETLPSRMVNPITSVIVIVMQRLHVDDVSGYILANELGYEHLCLPMEYEPSRQCRTSIGFKDPRTKEGELLFEMRFPRAVVERDKKVMGSYATAGQFQQRPAPRGGGMFKRADFEIISALPVGCRWVRGWDLAASTDQASAFTAGVLMGVTPSGEFVIADVVRGQFSPSQVETTIRNTASQDASAYAGVRGSIPQDPGAGGKAWARAIVKAAAGFPYRASTESGDKVTRAEPFAAQVEINNVKLLNGAWNKAFLDEIEVFPNATIKDQVDAASRAFMELNSAVPFGWYVSGGDDE